MNLRLARRGTAMENASKVSCYLFALLSYGERISRWGCDEFVHSMQRRSCRDRREVGVGDDQPASSFLAKHRQPRGNAVDRLAVDGLLDLDPVADHERLAVAGRDDVAELGPGGMPGKGFQVARLVVASAVGAEDLELLGQDLVDHRRVAGEQRVR